MKMTTFADFMPTARPVLVFLKNFNSFIRKGLSATGWFLGTRFREGVKARRWAEPE